MPIHIVSKSVFFTRFVFLASCFLPVLQYIQYKCSLFTLAMRLSFLACVIDPCHLSILGWPRNTVNSEIFKRILFSRNFAFAKFRENQTLANWRYHLLISVIHALFAIFFTSQMCLLTLFAKIKFSRKFPTLQLSESPLTGSWLFFVLIFSTSLVANASKASVKARICPMTSRQGVVTISCQTLFQRTLRSAKYMLSHYFHYRASRSNQLMFKASVAPGLGCAVNCF